ncbi:hypothetical protein UFOVP226_22 [uncultured Caudovirales phage]|uniref:Uncharacterized protein n=1 Tax=uncultured Caudovirales phage TaxID=2100421 RepID=A0A6J7WUY2_9CAUD|nr:hypothetical protein UFOVP226_22 [uncultured Caudovirales phage]
MATPTNLPTAFTAATVLPASSLNNLRGAFRILQVVMGTSSTVTSNSTTTYADTTLTATITPQASSSKVLVLVYHPTVSKQGDANSGVGLRLLRGATTLATFGSGIGYSGTTTAMTSSSSFAYLDSPAVATATTYKTQFVNNANAASVTVQVNSTTSSIILLEVSA